jgi:hypothetical protein
MLWIRRPRKKPPMISAAFFMRLVGRGGDIAGSGVASRNIRI